MQAKQQQSITSTNNQHPSFSAAYNISLCLSVNIHFFLNERPPYPQSPKLAAQDVGRSAILYCSWSSSSTSIQVKQTTPVNIYKLVIFTKLQHYAWEHEILAQFSLNQLTTHTICCRKILVRQRICL